ncbi:hypothetical protein [Oceanobacillus profundus]|uniref:Uncharacterized protein n=1 Tax=Oceanobacillus profundus TaxID=372463 RepID=A0A417YGC3_9BACI|nr:hypothetical protein [Oceanobacillus profundus]RHW31867.1 hypothetical protein D1B32_11555 [Oceanobacillus profundus]
MTIEKAIFITNVFAHSYPDLHTQLWKEFEENVHQSKRSGVFGADKLAYMKWLNEKKHDTFISLIDNSIVSR